MFRLGTVSVKVPATPSNEDFPCHLVSMASTDNVTETHSLTPWMTGPFVHQPEVAILKGLLF